MAISSSNSLRPGSGLNSPARSSGTPHQQPLQTAAGVEVEEEVEEEVRHGRDLTRLVWRWQQWLDACCPPPPPSLAGPSSSRGGLTTPELAWAYFRESDAFDKNSDNWSLFVQFGDDPAYGWARMMADLSKMHGIQYHISHLSRPPDLWIFDKVRRRRPSTTQQQQTGQVSTLPGSRGRGLEDSQASPELLEVVAIVQGDVSVVRSFEEVVGARLLSVNHALSRSLETLRSRAPPASVRQLDFWKSKPIQAQPLRGDPSNGEGKEVVAATGDAQGEGVDAVGDAAPANTDLDAPSSKASSRSKKPERGPDLAMLRAIETLRRDLGGGGGGGEVTFLPSDEERRAKELAKGTFNKAHSSDMARRVDRISSERKRRQAQGDDDARGGQRSTRMMA